MLLAGALRSRQSGVPTAALATLGTALVLGLAYRIGQAGGSLVCEHGAAQAYAGSAAPDAEARANADWSDDDD